MGLWTTWSVCEMVDLLRAKITEYAKLNHYVEDQTLAISPNEIDLIVGVEAQLPEPRSI